jgi:hypothetical protein
MINLISSQKSKLTSDWNSQLEDIFLRAPFYSIFAVNPTKMIDEESEESEEDSTQVKDSNLSELLSSLSNDINSWLEKYTVEFENISELESINIFPLLSAIFNKVFTQLHVLRKNMAAKKMKGDEEHLSDIARRFEYIFINALASFTRDGEVINSNTSSTAKQSALRDHSNFIGKEKTLQRNLKGLVDKNGQSIDAGSERNNVVSKIIEAIWEHPIFVANKSRKTMTEPLFLLKGQTASSKLSIQPNQPKRVVVVDMLSKTLLDKLMNKVKLKIKRTDRTVDFNNQSSLSDWVANNQSLADELILELNTALKESNEDADYFLDRHPNYHGTSIYKALSGE